MYMRLKLRPGAARPSRTLRTLAASLAAVLLAAVMVQLSAGAARAASGSCPTARSTAPPTVEAMKAIDLACKAVDARIRYSFGGGWGTHPGASYGWPDGTTYAANDGNVKGYDCSGFMHWIWYAVTGTENFLPLGADSQFHTSSHVAARFSASQGTGSLLPGDLVFWGNPNATNGIHHVAMYLGDGLIVQQSQSGTPANVDTLNLSGYAGAVRLTGFSSTDPNWQEYASGVDDRIANAEAKYGVNGCGSGGCTTGCSAQWYNDHPSDPLCNGGSSGGAGGGPIASGTKYWVDTFAAATGRDLGGTLNAGTNYVFCKEWGSQVGSGSTYNHWWLYTDMDTGGQDYVSAYYLSRWGNDEAKDNSGNTIPTCSWSSGGGTGGTKYWVDTFANAPARDGAGTLYAGTNYVFCKEWGSQVGSGSTYNHWWLFTDLDTGGQGWVSAYYLSRWGNDEAKDNSGNTIPNCGTDGKYWVKTFASAPGRDHGGTLYAGTNYVFCKVWGSQVGSGSTYNHWWLLTDMDTGGRDYVSAYYLANQGNDQANDIYGATIPTC
ncbi:C40 family peptidase [Streptomyces sp. NPDC086766]|uniref:C40 family peptidase n=1 Tax=Streptomyces sp. NPDC086766 TaxID=3365754 RepID=UPI00381E835D